MAQKTTNPVNREAEVELLKKWHGAIRVCHKAHIRSAAFMNRRNRLLGILVVVLTAIVGTSVFATLDSSPRTEAKILVGILSVTAAVLGGLQTFLNYGEKEVAHKEAAQKYGSLRREIEEFLAQSLTITSPPADFVTQIRTRWDQIDSDTPSLSQRLYDRVAKSIFSKLPKKQTAD